MPDFNSSNKYLYSMWSHMDSFSSQPGVNALARPSSKDAFLSDALTLYMDRFLSYRSLRFTCSYSFFFAAIGLSSFR